MSMNSFHSRKPRPAPAWVKASKESPPRSGVRADTRLVELGLAASRSDARRLIEAGRVLGPTGPVSKPSTEFAKDALLSLLEE